MSVKVWLRKNFLPVYTTLAILALLVLIISNIRLMGSIQKVSALKTAEIYVSSLEKFRTLYTSEVVESAVKNGMFARHDYKDHSNSIPLPATLTIKLGEEIGRQEDGLSATLVSGHPFKHRKGDVRLDEFNQEALDFFRDSPNRPFYRFVLKDDRFMLRYSKADIMRESCVACHNSHPQSPKTDWQVGDVRGALSVSLPLNDKSNQSVGIVRERIISSSILGILLFLIGLQLVNWLKEE